MKEREKRYVLLDRDGTVIVEKNYLSQPDAVELLPGAAAGLRLLQENGFGLVLITNQSGIGRGLFTVEDLERVHQRLRELLEAEGVRLDAIYSCPHAPLEGDIEGCDCRKPQPGLAQQASRDLGFRLKDSWVIGDKPADIELGIHCGARSILVRTGYGAESERAGAKPDFVAADLLSAARAILQSAWLTEPS